MSVNYDSLPEHMKSGARIYIEEKIKPGGFLCAVLSNNLTEAFVRADNINRDCMFEWVQWLFCECPREAWGNEEKVVKWLESPKD